MPGYPTQKPTIIRHLDRPPARAGKVRPVRQRKPVVNRHGVIVGEK